MPVVSFRELIGRADDETLQQLVGNSVVRLLAQLDPKLARPSRLRALVTDLYDPVELLRNPSSRAALISLLRRDEAEQLRDALPMMGGEQDTFIFLLRLRPRKGSNVEGALFRFFGVSVQEGSDTGEMRPETIEVSPQYALFPHQRDAVARIRSALAREPHRSVLHMPTGAGKTRTALHLIGDELRGVEPSVVIWLAYSEELCEQTASEFEVAWRHIGNRPISVYRFWGDRSLNIDHIRDGFLVAGLGKLYNSVKNEYGFWARLADRTRFVVIDEAHQATASTYRTVLELLTERHGETRLLGLTATPGRTWDDVEADRELATFFGGQKITLRVQGYSNPVQYLVENGYLARTEFKPLLYEGGLKLSSRDLQELEEALDVPSSILDRLAEDEQRNLLIVSRIEQMARRHSRILVFSASVTHAHVLGTVLRAREIHADTVTADTPKPARERIIQGYRSNAEDVRVLCNFGVLTTGFDAPRTSAALIARPTKSLVLFSQMVGRATRGPRAGGNEVAEVVTVIDQGLPGFGDVGEAFMNWEDVWNEPAD